MQGEEQDQHAGGGVAPMMSGPVVVDVFKEGWVEHLDLVVDRDIQGGDISFIFVFRFIISFWVTTGKGLYTSILKKVFSYCQLQEHCITPLSEML